VANYDAQISPGNQILRQIPSTDRQALLARADYVELPVGHTLARVADPYAMTFFPESGVIFAVSEMTSGHHLAIAAVGAEGAVGVGPVVGQQRYPLSLVVLVESSGYLVPTRVFTDVFHRSHEVRRAILTDVGRRLRELMTAAACNRVHSHRQRLARWLLVITDKAGVSSLPVTHETLAQLVGGPRHAVTVALKFLRRTGAIAHVRGRIEVLDRAQLRAHACECYAVPPRTGLYRRRS
jgi:CRP-like cAMP-binding protein